MKKLRDFKQQAKNLNRHTERGMGMLEASMQELGYAGPMVAAADGEIIDGSARHETAANVFGPEAEPIIVESDGKRPIVVVRKDIPNAGTRMARRLAAFANRTGQVNLEWDAGAIAELLAQEPNDFQGMFNGDELAGLIGQQPAIGEQPADATPKMDQAEELNRKWQVQPGDVWLIGRHRIVCSDARKWTETITVLATDPPYGMDYKAKLKPIIGDHAESLLALACGMKTEHSAYVFCRWDNLGSIPQPTSAITWVKNNWSAGDLEHAHARQTELVAFYPGRGHRWKGNRPTDVIQADRIRPTQHPTEKPVELLMEIIGWTTGVVTDLFLGSGTTMLACENLKRECIGVELIPNYCAVALQRMADAFPGIEIKKL